MDSLSVSEAGEVTDFGQDMVRISIGHAKVVRVFHFNERYEAFAKLVHDGLLDQTTADEYLRWTERQRTIRTEAACVYDISDSVADVLARTIAYGQPELEMDDDSIASHFRPH